MEDLSNIGTVAIVMLENRSFDHMLGYLSLIEPKLPVDGLVESASSGTDYTPIGSEVVNDNYLNVSEEDQESHYPFRRPDTPLAIDLPHDRLSVLRQLGTVRGDGSYQMDGFINAFYASTESRLEFADPMAFFSAKEVPMHDFFARHFAICDRWFSPIPTDTQPNRLMSLSGCTLTDTTAGMPPVGDTVIDWLERNKIQWRVYSDDISFFALFKRYWLKLLTDDGHFRKFSELTRDVLKADTQRFPQVIFIEPSFRDSPMHPDHEANDNHPPLPVGFGEQFLREIYQALTPSENRKVWDGLVMFVTYDEHGGFFDHVSPLRITTACGQNRKVFESSGPRVPAFVISPFVRQSIYSKNLDHTAILEFLAERFTPGTPYSPDVEQRLSQPGFNAAPGRGRISEVLDLRVSPHAPAQEPTLSFEGLRVMEGKKAPENANERAFDEAITQMINEHPDEVARKYPELLHWKHNIRIARNR